MPRSRAMGQWASKMEPGGINCNNESCKQRVLPKKILTYIWPGWGVRSHITGGVGPAGCAAADGDRDTWPGHRPVFDRDGGPIGCPPSSRKLLASLIFWRHDDAAQWGRPGTPCNWAALKRFPAIGGTFTISMNMFSEIFIDLFFAERIFDVFLDGFPWFSWCVYVGVWRLCFVYALLQWTCIQRGVSRGGNSLAIFKQSPIMIWGQSCALMCFKWLPFVFSCLLSFVDIETWNNRSMKET